MRLPIGAMALVASLLVAALAGGAPASESVAPAPSPTQPPPAPAETSPATGPRLEVERDAIDLGAVTRGTPAEGSFTLRNLGSDVLRILSAKPG